MPTPSTNSLRLTIGDRTYALVSDDNYLRQFGGTYEPDMVRLFRHLLRKEFYVADVGANIGCTSILFGELARRVISFEPSPSTFRFLEHNIACSGLRNVELYNCALGARQGESKLTFSSDNRAGGFVSDEIKTSGGHVTESIHLETLDAMVVRAGVPKLDLVKIDTEGFEKSVIEGARKVLAAHAPLVVLELNHWCLNVFQRICVPDFLDYLRSIFPILYAVEGDRYLSLHDAAESYIVMYRHINEGKYRNLLAASSPSELEAFHSNFAHAS